MTTAFALWIAIGQHVKAAEEPIDKQPYKVRVLFTTGPGARLDARGRSALLADWEGHVRRFVGPVWKVEVAPGEHSASLALGGDLETLDPDGFDAVADGVDKVWVIRASGLGSGLVFTGREYDAPTRRLGPFQRREAPAVRDASRVLFLFTLDLFVPYAEVGAKFAKDVSLTVRGAALPAASPVGRVVALGGIFQPLRVIPQKGGPPLVREIPSTFLRVEAVEPSGARCAFVSLYTNPLTDRLVQKNTKLAALGVKPGKSATRLRFLTLPDRAPAAGFVLTARDYPDGVARDVATTDRGGRVTLPAGFADGLVILRLLAGTDEPVLEFPLMPGTDLTERTLPAFDPKPSTVALKTKLDSIRDEVVDLVAVRARLEARLKARLDGEDWAGIEATLKEYLALPSRESFATAVQALKDAAARRQAETKTAVLTKTAQARLADLQNLVERYLDDEGFKAYADALEQHRKGEVDAKTKAAPKAKTVP